MAESRQHEALEGALKIRVKRGIELANRDVCSSSSDPYVVIRMGDEEVKTQRINRNCNPEWECDLTLPLFLNHHHLPIKLYVFDHDHFSWDDPMGEAEIHIKDYLEEYMMHMGDDDQEAEAEAEAAAEASVIRTVQPGDGNCLAEESEVVWTAQGKMVQNMILNLNNVETGKVEIQLQYIFN